MAEESRDAFESLGPEEISRQEKLVIEAIGQSPTSDDGGLTCDEAEQLTGLPHQSCSARFTALKRRGVLVWRPNPDKPEKPIKRPTRSGRDARVWWLATQQGGIANG